MGVEYRVYEKSAHLCAIFCILHLNWNHCWGQRVAFKYLQCLINQNKRFYQWHCVTASFDVRWIWSRVGVYQQYANSTVCLFDMIDPVISLLTSSNDWKWLNTYVIRFLLSIWSREWVIYSEKMWIISMLQWEFILIHMGDRIIDLLWCI